MQKALFWFRRDLRLEDNNALYRALIENDQVYPFFIFDPSILEELPSDDHRLTFIFDTLERLNTQLATERPISYFFGAPEVVIEKLLAPCAGAALYTNADYEPYARIRDKKVYDLCQRLNRPFYRLKDHVIFEQNEIVKDDGRPYVVFTPFKKKWLSTFNWAKHLPNYPSENYLFKLTRFSSLPAEVVCKLEDFGKKHSSLAAPSFSLATERIENYEATRNFMEVDGTTKLGTYLRFGTQSTRHIVAKAFEARNSTFLSELIWREFFQQIIWHFPKTMSQSFKPQYDRIKWRNDPAEFERWCEGTTGYALVDAGMRELNQTGYMHNRVRMLTASFLCKHLLIDWRWGEAYFAKKLFDYELASNVGNWQWAAGSGVDAAPYFRIFNPTTQIQKFDKNLIYIKQWVPDFQEFSYPAPIIDHKEARERCLTTYNQALKP
jgi:deoxyribodipyrimidine photo-lyase